MNVTSPQRDATSTSRRLAPIALVAALVCAGVLVMYAGRHLGFFFDEWNVVTGRRTGSLDDFLEPHNGHPALVPVAIYKVLFATFGIDVYWPFRLAVTLLHLLTCALVYLYARRRLDAIWALVPTLLLLFLGAGWEDLLWPFQVGFVGSVAAGVGALLLLERRTTGADAAAALALFLAVASSSIGVPFVAAAVVTLVLSRPDWRRLWVPAVPTALYGIWYLSYDAGGQLRLDNLPSAPQYVADAASAAIAGLAGFDLAWGPVLLALAVAGIWVARHTDAAPTPPNARLAGLLVGALASWGLTALARGDLGAPGTSRYVYPGAVWVLLISVELLRPRRVGRWGVAVAAVLVAGALIGGVGQLRDGQRGLRSTWENVRASLSAVEIAGDRAPAEYQPDSRFAPQISAGPYIEAVRELGSPALTPDELEQAPERQKLEADRVLRETNGMVLAPAPRGAVPGREPLEVAAATGGAERDAGACVRFAPRTADAALELVLDPGESVGVAARGAPVEVRSRRFAAGYSSAPMAIVEPGRTAVQLTAAPDRAGDVDWDLRLTSAQPFTACPR